MTTALHPDLRLRRATLADAPRLLAWRNDPDTRAASHDAAEVPADDHLAWLARVLADPGRQLWLAWLGEQAVGTVRADRPAGALETTLSWTIAPEWRGRGLGVAMLRLALPRCAAPLHAEVKSGNRASARIAEAAGLALHGEADGTLHFRSPADAG